jgi:hypothetical protein
MAIGSASPHDVHNNLIQDKPKAIAYDIKLVIRTFEDYNPIHG